MNSNHNTLLGLRALLLLVLSAGAGTAVGLAEGVGAGFMAGLGAIAVLHVLVSDG